MIIVGEVHEPPLRLILKFVNYSYSPAQILRTTCIAIPYNQVVCDPFMRFLMVIVPAAALFAPITAIQRFMNLPYDYFSNS